MIQRAPVSAATVSAARLMIHAERGRRSMGGLLELPLLRLRSWYPGGPWKDHSAPLHLQIDDLHGRPVVVIENAGPLIELPLTAGTYHVAAFQGTLRRAYTVTLEPGATFDLHLRLTPA